MLAGKNRFLKKRNIGAQRYCGTVTIFELSVFVSHYLGCQSGFSVEGIVTEIGVVRLLFATSCKRQPMSERGCRKV